MTWWRVPATAWIQAADYESAVMEVMNRLYGSDRPPGFMAQAGPAEERTDEQMAPMLQLYAALDEAAADLNAGIGIGMEGHPGVVLSPAAAASLAVLEFEARQGPDDPVVP